MKNFIGGFFIFRPFLWNFQRWTPNVATEEGAGVQVYLLTPRGSPVGGPVSEGTPEEVVCQSQQVAEDVR